MSAFEVRKLKSGRRANDFIPCEAHCKQVSQGKSTGGSSDLGYRAASFEVLIIGYPTLLCSRCTKTWRAAWQGALDGAGEEAA